MRTARNPEFLKLAIATLIVGAAAGVGLAASDRPPATLAERVAGAQRVVVATTENIESRMQKNRFGDELIVSRVRLRVVETLKGVASDAALLDLEGGTLNGVTLRVSDLPDLVPGERAVFFLGAGSKGIHQPHLRGQGILKLDENDYVRGSSLGLDEIRRVARGRAPIRRAR